MLTEIIKENDFDMENRAGGSPKNSVCEIKDIIDADRYKGPPPRYSFRTGILAIPSKIHQ